LASRKLFTLTTKIDEKVVNDQQSQRLTNVHVSESTRYPDDAPSTDNVFKRSAGVHPPNQRDFKAPREVAVEGWEMG
jgi:hypothetical protein